MTMKKIFFWESVGGQLLQLEAECGHVFLHLKFCKFNFLPKLLFNKFDGEILSKQYNNY